MAHRSLFYTLNKFRNLNLNDDQRVSRPVHHSRLVVVVDNIKVSRWWNVKDLAWITVDVIDILAITHWFLSYPSSNFSHVISLCRNERFPLFNRVFSGDSISICIPVSSDPWQQDANHSLANESRENISDGQRYAGPNGCRSGKSMPRQGV